MDGTNNPVKMSFSNWIPAWAGMMTFVVGWNVFLLCYLGEA
jgi:hypothetical protein